MPCTICPLPSPDQFLPVLAINICNVLTMPQLGRGKKVKSARAGQRQRQDRGNSVWKSDSFCTPQPSRPPPHRWRERAELIDQEFISDSDSGHCLGTRNVETFIINISWSWHFVIQSATCVLFKPIFAFNILNLLKSWPLKITYLILWMRSLINKFNWLVCLIVAACGDI